MKPAAWTLTRSRKMMKALDKIICLLVAFPPVYMLYRFVKWYLRTEPKEASEETAEQQPAS